MDKYDEPTKIEEMKGMGKLYKKPFASAGLDLTKPDYYLWTNFNLDDGRAKIFPIESFNLVIGKCDKCRHKIVEVGEGFKHIILLRDKAPFPSPTTRFCITDVCHEEEAGSENSYSSWGRRCRCKEPNPEEGMKELKEIEENRLKLCQKSKW